MSHRAEDTDDSFVQQRTDVGGYREDDDPVEGEEFSRKRRFERLRTVMISVICSGLVALAIVYVVELGARDNAVNSCRLEMQTRSLLAEQADQAADNVLGDKTEKPPVPTFKFEGTSLAEFKPLIVAQARANRRRASEFARSVRDCEELFPRPKFFGIIG